MSEPCCERCGSLGKTENPLTNHHVYPKRHRIALLMQGINRGELERLCKLCRKCHDEIERVIAQYEGDKVLYFTLYAKIARDFVRWMVVA